MEHVYAALLVNESGAEVNERNLSAVLDAAGCAVGTSRTKALVAALEGVDVPRDGGNTASDPGAGTEGPAPAASADGGDGDVPREGTRSR